MKVQQFRETIANSEQIVNKIKAFKVKLAFEAMKKNMESCAVCGSSLNFHFEKTLAGMKIKEVTHCLHCKGAAVQRFYSLN